MKAKLLALVTTTGLITGLFAMLGEHPASAKGGPILERVVDANHLQIRINGQWEDIPMVALSDSACARSRHNMNRYCP